MLLSLLILVNIIVISHFIHRSYNLYEDVKSINEELEDLKTDHYKTRTFYQLKKLRKKKSF